MLAVEYLGMLICIYVHTSALQIGVIVVTVDGMVIIWKMSRLPIASDCCV